MRPRQHRSFTAPLCLLLIATSHLSAADEFVLHDATPVRLRLTRNLSSADCRVGENADFEVLDDVKIGEFLVIARGATAIATVTEAQSKRRMARGGKLDVNIDYVRLIDDEKVALRAVKEVKGGGHTGAMTGGMVASAIVFFPAAPFFLFMHGKDITIPKGTEITAYVNGEIKLDPTKFASKAAVQPNLATVASNGATSAGNAAAPAAVANTGGLVSVAFVSNPSNALVTFSGVAIGKTPVTAQLMPGTYKISIAADGYDGWSQDVVVEAGKPSTVTAMLNSVSKQAEK